MQTLEIILTVITLASLLVASYQDIKYRAVHDIVWLVQIIFSLLFLLIYIFAVEPLPFILAVAFGLNISFAFLLAIVTYLFGLFGTGDSLAIIALGISVPWIFSFIHAVPVTYIFFPPITLIIFNMIYGIFLIILYLFAKNLYNYRRYNGWFTESQFNLLNKVRLLITCYQVPLSDIQSQKFADPAEIYENGGWHAYLPTSIESGELDELLKKEHMLRIQTQESAANTNRTYIWMRPQIPGLPILLFAFLVFLAGGNIFITILQYPI